MTKASRRAGTLCPLLVIASSMALVSCDGIAIGEAADVESEIKALLTVPGTARITDLERCSGDQSMWTGKLDAQNRMGMYSGPQPFFYKSFVLTTVTDKAFNQKTDACYGRTDATWYATDFVDPIDDSKTYMAFGEADVELSSGTDDVITMRVRCQSGETQMWVDWGKYLGNDSGDHNAPFKSVTVRIDKEKAKVERWDVSTDDRATFAPGSPVGLLRRMANADKVIFQTTPYREPPITATFKTAGFSKAIEPISKNCGWQIAP